MLICNRRPDPIVYLMPKSSPPPVPLMIPEHHLRLMHRGQRSLPWLSDSSPNRPARCSVDRYARRAWRNGASESVADNLCRAASGIQRTCATASNGGDRSYYLHTYADDTSNCLSLQAAPWRERIESASGECEWRDTQRIAGHSDSPPGVLRFPQRA